MKREGADGGAAATVCRHSRTRDMPLIEEMADVSDGPSGAPPDPDENYAAFTERRLEKEWEEQLEMARAANVGVDEHDVDVRDLYGEQSVHNYPDVHADWGDARHARATVARAARDAGAFPNAEASGWNTEYRAQLEHAMGVVRDSKEVMKNLKTIRRRKKDIDEGVEVGHLRGKSAKEANREWEASRAERRERERRRRRGGARRRRRRRRPNAKDPSRDSKSFRISSPADAARPPRRSPRRTTGGPRGARRRAAGETPSTRRRARGESTERTRGDEPETSRGDDDDERDESGGVRGDRERLDRERLGRRFVLGG